MLLKDLLQLAENRFNSAGCLDSKLDAEFLLCHQLKVNKSYFFSHYGEDLGEKICEEYFLLMDQRAGGKPLQYIVGTQEFMGHEFLVDNRVLIPRKETESLVELALDRLLERKPPRGGYEILDLCCGSGAIAISLFLELRNRTKLKRVVASDISEDALTVAKENAAKNDAGNVQFIAGDLFAPFDLDKKDRGKKPFDLIISNPPYIPTAVLPTLQREIRNHEPMLALDGGQEGVDFYIRILGEAHKHLKKGGLLILEIGSDQAPMVSALAIASEKYGPAEIRKDLAGLDRICILAPA